MKVLITIPCYNAQETIVECLTAIQTAGMKIQPEHEVHVLIIDDLSTDQTETLVQQFIHNQPNPTHWSYLRVSEKVYSGGARNYGINQALKDAFDILLFCDSDCLILPKLLEQYLVFFRNYPNELVAASAIIPAGNFWQKIDTLLNASKFLFQTAATSVKYFDSLASGNFAIHLQLFREKPIFFQKVFDGDDWLFFNDLKKAFNLSGLAFLPYAGFKHLSSTNSWERCLKSSKRYANAYCHKISCGQTGVFDKYPCLHYSLPRFWLIVIRMFRAGYLRYFYVLPILLGLDFLRSRYIVKKIKGSVI